MRIDTATAQLEAAVAVPDEGNTNILALVQASLGQDLAWLLDSLPRNSPRAIRLWCWCVIPTSKNSGVLSTWGWLRGFTFQYGYLTWNDTCIRLRRHCAARGLLAPAAVAQCLGNGTHPSLRQKPCYLDAPEYVRPVDFGQGCFLSCLKMFQAGPKISGAS